MKIEKVSCTCNAHKRLIVFGTSTRIEKYISFSEIERNGFHSSDLSVGRVTMSTKLHLISYNRRDNIRV